MTFEFRQRETPNDVAFFFYPRKHSMKIGIFCKFDLMKPIVAILLPRISKKKKIKKKEKESPLPSYHPVRLG